MKLTKNFFVASATALIFIVTISIMASCVKDRDHDILAAENATYAMWAYDDAINIANEAIRLNTGDNLVLYKTTGSCSKVINQPGRLMIAFEGTNCLCNDGRYRKGKIIVDYTGNYNDSGSVHTITFEKYFIDDNEIKGSQTITHMGSELNMPTYAVQVNGVIDILDSLGELTYKAELSRTWTAGSSTIQFDDDYYELKGTAQGVNVYGNNYAFITKEPIVKPTNIICRYFTQGILEVQPQGRTFRSVDFGTGNCEKTATVTIDRKQHNMIMR